MIESTSVERDGSQLVIRVPMKLKKRGGRSRRRWRILGAQVRAQRVDLLAQDLGDQLAAPFDE